MPCSSTIGGGSRLCCLWGNGRDKLPCTCGIWTGLKISKHCFPLLYKFSLCISTNLKNVEIKNITTHLWLFTILATISGCWCSGFCRRCRVSIWMGALLAIWMAFFLFLAVFLALHCIPNSRALTSARRTPMYTRTCRLRAADFRSTMPAMQSETPMRMPIVNTSYKILTTVYFSVRTE